MKSFKFIGRILIVSDKNRLSRQVAGHTVQPEPDPSFLQNHLQ